MTPPKDKRTAAHAATNVGNNRDMLARFYAVRPFESILPPVEAMPVTGKRRVLPPIDPSLSPEEKHAEQKRRNRDLTRAKRAATRINKPLQICVPSGEAVQRAAIRREMAKA